MGIDLRERVKQWLASIDDSADCDEVTPKHSGSTEDTTSQPDAGPAQVYGLIRIVRKAGVLVVGLTVVLIGIIMIVTPGPAVVVIPLGLGILATEFLWAKRILKSLRKRLLKSYEQLGGKRAAANSANVKPSPPA